MNTLNKYINSPVFARIWLALVLSLSNQVKAESSTILTTTAISDDNALTEQLWCYPILNSSNFSTHRVNFNKRFPNLDNSLNVNYENINLYQMPSKIKDLENFINFTSTLDKNSLPIFHQVQELLASFQPQWDRYDLNDDIFLNWWYSYTHLFILSRIISILEDKWSSLEGIYNQTNNQAMPEGLYILQHEYIKNVLNKLWCDWLN